MRWLSDRNVLENESRAVIFKYIKENPETYAQKITDQVLSNMITELQTSPFRSYLSDRLLN